jgi:hypothetical protein
MLGRPETSLQYTKYRTSALSASQFILHGPARVACPFITIMDQKEVSHRQDVACSRCRERKTKCSREKPACESCRSDNIECDYSVPEKRVNHTKLLLVVPIDSIL